MPLEVLLGGWSHPLHRRGAWAMLQCWALPNAHVALGLLPRLCSHPCVHVALRYWPSAGHTHCAQVVLGFMPQC
jgi:hypothetical protein